MPVAALSFSNVTTALETRWKAMHWLSQRAYKRAKLSWHVDVGVIIIICAVTPLGLRPHDMWKGQGLPCSGRLALSEDHRCGNLAGAIISKCIFILRCRTKPAMEICLDSVCQSVLLLSVKCNSQFSWNRVRNWAQWHISTPRLCSPVARTALEGFSENVFKMLSERYVAAIKPAACVHSLLSSPAHVCSVASPLLQP